MTDTNPEQPRVPYSVYVGIFLCSMAVLMLQILLTRIFSFSIWYHLAYLTVSTAMLGFGVAGSMISAWPSLNQDHARRFWTLATCGAGLSTLAALFILAPRPLDPVAMYTDSGAFFLGLLGYYALLAIPFTLAGVGVAGPLSRYPHRASALYAIDLLGAALGCLAAVLVLNELDGPSGAVICCGLLVASGVMYADSAIYRGALAVVTVVLFAGVSQISPLIDFMPSPSKALGHTLNEQQGKIRYTEWSAVNRVDVVQSGYPLMNFWSDVGLSPHYQGPYPFGINIVYDGDNGSNAFKVTGDDSLRILDEHILRTPYVLVEEPRVMVIGVGGGVDVLNALRRGATRVVGVELQPITVRLHGGLLKDWIGGAMQSPEVELVAAEGRHFARVNEETFDVIQITATDTFSAQSTGAYVLAESYLYTEEAMVDFLEHLEDDGLLSLILGDVVYNEESIPPPLATRLALTGLEALRSMGVENPERHVIYTSQEHSTAGERVDAALDEADTERTGTTLRGTQVGSVLIRKTPFTPEEVGELQAFAQSNEFVIELAPGMETGRKISALVNTPPDALSAALALEPVSVHPLTDDRPFFYHIQRWSTLFGGVATLWMFPGSTVGQIVLVMMLAQAIVFGGFLITFPLLRGAREHLSGGNTFRYLLYFLGLGVGFMFIEISFVQKYILLLGYPTYSLSVTIASLLIFTALGAALSPLGWKDPRRMLLLVLAGTTLFGLIEIFVMPSVRTAFLGSPLWARIALTFVMQAPMGMLLGTYFTTGIEILRTRAPRLVPWAWAVNGVGSVASSVLAVILAMGIGFSGVTFVAICVYAVGVGGMLSSFKHETSSAS